jgi:hypothetical protein
VNVVVWRPKRSEARRRLFARFASLRFGFRRRDLQQIPRGARNDK